ncbi:hypothetical protein NPIL_477171 [Nephila pilipes]|uniref:Uncharacterized protein n=1 Tax=Nephila pilipes TaxID=299642 RepID=A0A8X6U6C2_NEPPI|nr:hypothetical protein NPIL_477171 [Nephila pilipes]
MFVRSTTRRVTSDGNNAGSMTTRQSRWPLARKISGRQSHRHRVAFFRFPRKRPPADESARPPRIMGAPKFGFRQPENNSRKEATFRWIRSMDFGKLFSTLSHPSHATPFWASTRGLACIAGGVFELPSDCELHPKRYIRAVEQFSCSPQMDGDKLAALFSL